MKKLLSLLLALGLVFALAACGAPKAKPADDQTQASDASYVQANGKLVIGYTVYAPMNYTDDAGKFTGFDTELATLVCEKLGVKPDFREINWDSKILELDAKSIDCIWNGMTITDEIKENTAVTKPYLKNAQVVLMKDGASYDSTASLVGKNVAAEQESSGQKAIEGDENLSKATFIPKKRQTDCLLEVKAGTVDAAVLDLTLAKTMTGEGTSYSDLAIMDRLGKENYGVAFRKGSDLCAEANKIFDALVADGTMAALAEKYDLDLPETAQ